MQQSDLKLELPSGISDRRTLFDRRIGERRVTTIPVTRERRTGRDRRQVGDRRESPGGHLRNALQVVAALVETGAVDIPLDQTLRRLRLALAEIERLERWGRQLGEQLRAAASTRAAGSSGF
jgi:hypothetical protein